MGNVKYVQCIRPQCGKKYRENEVGRYCMCGAILQKCDKERDDPSITNSNKTERATAKARLILLLDDDSEVAFDLGEACRIGISTEDNKVDIDLSPYFDRTVISRCHAVVFLDKNAFYIRKETKRFSVHVNEKAVDDCPVKLVSGDMVLLSKKVLFQFEEV